jgi:hypothetical protein
MQKKPGLIFRNARSANPGLSRDSLTKASEPFAMRQLTVVNRRFGSKPENLKASIVVRFAARPDMPAQPENSPRGPC